MVQNKFLKTQIKRNSNNSRYAMLVSKTMLYLSITIILTAVCYMAINLDKADSIIGLWISFMAVGVALAFTSILIGWMGKNKLDTSR